MFTHCTCSPAHETLNPNLDCRCQPAAQAHSPPHTQSVTPPLHPSRDSRVAQATSAPRPPTAAAPPPLARRPPSPRHRTQPRPASSGGAARGDPLARGDPRRPDPVPAPPLLFSDRIHGGIRRLPLLPLPPRRAGEPAQLRISPSPQWPSGRPPHRHRLPLRPRPPPSYPLGSAPAPPSPNGLRQRHLHRLSPPAPLSGDLRQAGGRGAAASSPAPGRGAAPAGAGVGWGKPPLLQAARGERVGNSGGSGLPEPEISGTRNVGFWFLSANFGFQFSKPEILKARKTRPEMFG